MEKTGKMKSRQDKSTTLCFYLCNKSWCSDRVLRINTNLVRFTNPHSIVIGNCILKRLQVTGSALGSASLSIPYVKNTLQYISIALKSNAATGLRDQWLPKDCLSSGKA